MVALARHELSRSHAHQALLVELVQDLAGSLDLDEVLSRSLAAIRRLVSFRGGSIALVGDGVLTVVAAAPEYTPDLAQLRLPFGQGLSGRAAAEFRTIYSPDIHTDPRVLPESRQSLSASQITSYLAVPVVAHGDIVGVLQIDSPEVDAFGEHERDLVGMLAPLVGSAIDNSRSWVAQLHAEEQAAEVERLRSDFIAIVSHELRTPLTALLGFSDLLTRIPVDHQLANQSDHLLDRVESSLTRLTRLVDELESLATLDAGGLDVSARPISVSDLLAQATARVASIRPLACEVESALPMVRADPVRLTEALDALLDNAVKFSQPGSMITVTAIHRGDAVEIGVIDEGDGVPGAHADRVFERFTQAEPPLVRRVGGLGLGLPVARALVERMGGALDLVPGQGGRFIVRLPVVTQ